MYYSKAFNSDRQPPLYRFDQGVSQNIPEEIRLFNLIKAAYVNGRYDPGFVVTKEDIETLMPKLEMLKEVANRICEERIGLYIQD